MQKEELRLCRKQQPLANSLRFPLLSLLLSLLSLQSCVCHLSWALTSPLHLCGCCWPGLSRAGIEGLHSEGMLGTAPHQLLVLVSLFLFPVFVFFFFSWGDVCHFNFKKTNKTPTMTKPDINRILVGTV